MGGSIHPGEAILGKDDIRFHAMERQTSNINFQKSVV